MQRRLHEKREATTKDTAIDLLVGRHGPLVWRVAVAIVRDDSLADDVTQDVMVKAWAALDAFDGDVPLPWLRRVARNTAISSLRSRARVDVTARLDARESLAPSVERQVEAKALSAAVHDAMGLLDPDARAMLVVQQIDGATYEELAEGFDLTPTAVKAKLFRGRHQLKLSTQGWED